MIERQKIWELKLKIIMLRKFRNTNKNVPKLKEENCTLKRNGLQNTERKIAKVE